MAKKKRNKQDQEAVILPSGPSSKVKLPQDVTMGSHARTERTATSELPNSKSKGKGKEISTASPDKTAEEPKTSSKGKQPSTFDPGNVENIFKFGSLPATNPMQPRSTAGDATKTYAQAVNTNAGPSKFKSTFPAPVANMIPKAETQRTAPSPVKPNPPPAPVANMLPKIEPPVPATSPVKPSPPPPPQEPAQPPNVPPRMAYMNSIASQVEPNTDDSAPPPDARLKRAFRDLRNDLNNKVTALEYLAQAQKASDYKSAAAKYQSKVDRLEEEVIELQAEVREAKEVARGRMERLERDMEMLMAGRKG